MTDHLVKNLLRAADGGLVSRYGGQRWTPGEWVEVGGALDLCRNGLHANVGASDPEAFRAACGYVYPQAGPWRVEIGGEVWRDTDKLCARRMRIVEPLDRAAIFRAAFPGSEPRWLACVDDTIEAARIARPARKGNRDARDVVSALDPWRTTSAAGYIPHGATFVAAAAGAYNACIAAATVATANIDPDVFRAGAAADATAVTAATAAGADVYRARDAGLCARYYFARAVAPRDSRTKPANPFAVLTRHYAEGGNWQDVAAAWRRA